MRNLSLQENIEREIMTTSSDLIVLCEKKNIGVDFVHLPCNGSVSVEIGDICYVGIDDSQMTEAERKVHLAHEIGHCETASFYRPYSPIDQRSKHEAQANKWAIKKLLPKQELISVMEKGITEVWEIAEHFAVTEDFVKKALNLYMG